ncbi:D-cysteine desulfhydrase family protein [Microbulbifer thermotolerans]|uniref:D-cysteine desulfhydrase family protein n=1 Tax=Microbulbifer thermotolerans TaxID=252514 RepID=A0AB35HWI0_MICTH|nr:D-cysteine desulfhydrase family protein [Microbulbifer thermotolerans]MCX2795017.1 D-cysteine desulfhydrase family protein [Microbulbifer thermotolerans]MCX2800585.1 D-cysteine desulfhydrase family protein [Microbulbifer thermotolerans]MCX2833689.1 D-cysteine desulfhydrase family protein [Microbulbifer thermotolerans]
MNLSLPPRIPLARLPTPLQPLDRITEKYSTPHGGPRLWVKRDDLTETAMSGNKLRKLEFVAGAARAQGCDTLITCGGIQSNHCRTTALVGARLGMRVQLILRGEEKGVPDGNLLVDRLAGASTAFYPARQYFETLPELFVHWCDFYADRGHKAFCIPTGASDGWGIWGYIAAAEELLADCRAQGFEPEHIICATGSGGTQAGLSLGCHLLGANARVTGYAVCDSADYFQRKVLEDIRHWEALNSQSVDETSLDVRVNADYIGPGYAEAEEPVYRAIAEAASLEGLLLDPVYTGKAFYGLLQELRKGSYRDCENLVFVHTGGQFGLFPHREMFPFLL